MADDIVFIQVDPTPVVLETSIGSEPPILDVYVNRGEKGDTGPQGIQGIQGPTGATGPQGPTGPTGPQGPQGDIGPTGATGPQGAKGDTGETGAQGPSGVVSVTSPITNTGSSTAANIGIDQSLLTIGQSQVTGLTSTISGLSSGISANTTALAGKAELGSANSFTTGGHTITNNAVGTVPLALKGIASQTANMFEIRDENNTTYASITRFGTTSLGGSVMSGGRLMVQAGGSLVGLQVRDGGNSANIQEWQASAGTILSRISSLGTFIGTGGASLNNSANTSANSLFVNNSVAANAVAVIRGAASQSASLLSLQNDSGSVIANFTAPVNNVPRLNLGSSDLSATLGVNLHAAGGVGVVVKGAASQTNDLQQWQNSAGAILGKVDGNGFASFGGGTVLGNSVLSVSTYGTSQGGVLVRGTSGQSSNLFILQDSAGTTIGGRNANGQIFSGSSAPQTFAVGGATTAASGTGTTATITTTSAHNLAVGDRVTVAGITPTGYNGTYIVTAVGSTTTFSYSNTTTGAQTVAGTVSVDAQASFTARSAATPALLVRGNGFATDLARWLTSSGSLAVGINPYGSVTVNASANTFRSDNPANYVLRTIGATNQLGDPLQIQNSSNTVLGGRNANAQIFSGSSSSIAIAVGGATTAASGTGTAATITTTSAHGLAIGDRVTIAGVIPAGYNGTYIVTAVPTTTTLTYANATTGAQTQAGTVSVDSQASITTRSAATAGVVIRAAANQVNDLFQVQNSSGSVLAYVTAGGTIQGANVVSNAAMRANGSLASSGVAAVSIVSNATIGHIIGQNITVVPATPSGGGVLYVEAGALKYKGSSGTVTTIANA